MQPRDGRDGLVGLEGHHHHSPSPHRRGLPGVGLTAVTAPGATSQTHEADVGTSVTGHRRFHTTPHKTLSDATLEPSVCVSVRSNSLSSVSAR